MIDVGAVINAYNVGWDFVVVRCGGVTMDRGGGLLTVHGFGCDGVTGSGVAGRAGVVGATGCG
jgi:hypothetical protein